MSKIANDCERFIRDRVTVFPTEYDRALRMVSDEYSAHRAIFPCYPQDGAMDFAWEAVASFVRQRMHGVGSDTL